MKLKQAYEAILIELNKNYGTPDLLLEDFNHFINKGIYQWVQKRYNVYDTNQQTTDDVQVLKTSEALTINIVSDKTTKGNVNYFTRPLLPSYFHMLNCFLEFSLADTYKCYPSGSIFMSPAKRLTSDQESTVLNNAWLRPSYRQPYYKVQSGGPITNTYISTTILITVTTPSAHGLSAGQSVFLDFQTGAMSGVTPSKNRQYTVTSITNAMVFTIAGTGFIVQGTAANCYIPSSTKGSSVSVTYGKDETIFVLTKIHCDYVKYPTPITLTYAQLDSVSDTSPDLEFKEDICHEIIKEVVKLIALNTGNPLLQSYDAVNQSVPAQGGQQAQPQQ